MDTMTAQWTKDLPCREGWYFWKRSKRTRDPLMWVPYFYECDDIEDPGFWQEGALMTPPKGGLWCKINTKDIPV